MAINTYATLVSASTEWLARDQDTTLTARIPDFITLCEAKLNRDLYHVKMEKRSYASFNLSNSEPEYVSLPSDFQSMRRIRLSSVTGKPRLEYKSQMELDDYRTRNGNTTGQPKYFTIFGDELEFCPTPDSAYTIEMVYRATLSALTSINTSNWLLSFAPDIYLYGTLLEATPYMQQDERIAVWAAGFSSALEALNRSSISMQFNGQPLVMRSQGTLP